MRIPLRRNVKVVTPAIVILIAGLPLGLAAMAENPKVEPVLWTVGVGVLVVMMAYFLWTMMFTRLEISGDNLTVTTPASTRQFIIPDDIKKVKCGYEVPGGVRDVYFENPTGRYIFMEGKYRLPAESRLAAVLVELEKQANAR